MTALLTLEPRLEGAYPVEPVADFSESSDNLHHSNRCDTMICQASHHCATITIT